MDEKRIEEITVSEITKATKINRSTFYVYFKDVYDVLDQIENAFLPSIHNFDRCVDPTNPEEVYEYWHSYYGGKYGYGKFGAVQYPGQYIRRQHDECPHKAAHYYRS